MQTLSPWATKADVEAAREELKADIATLHANLTAMHGDLRAVQALLTEQNKRRPWWRRLLTAGVVLMAVMAASAGVRADFMEGNDLYDACTGPDSKLVCLGYVMAIADAVRAPAAVKGSPMCGSENVAAEQVVDVVTRYLAAHPDKRHLSASSLVAHALAEAYPCP